MFYPLLGEQKIEEKNKDEMYFIGVKAVLLLAVLEIPVFLHQKKLILMQSPLVQINLPRKMELKD